MVTGEEFETVVEARFTKTHAYVELSTLDTAEQGTAGEGRVVITGSAGRAEVVETWTVGDQLADRRRGPFRLPGTPYEGTVTVAAQWRRTTGRGQIRGTPSGASNATTRVTSTNPKDPQIYPQTREGEPCEDSTTPPGVPKAATVKAAGFDFVVRYVGTPGRRKNITAAEFRDMTGAGVGVALVFENRSGDALAGRAAGARNARAALNDARSFG